MSAPTDAVHEGYMRDLQDALEVIYTDHGAAAANQRDDFYMALGNVFLGWITRQTEEAILIARSVNRGERP